MLTDDSVWRSAGFPGVYASEVMHELGHTMGLMHVAATDSSPAVMFWETGRSYATSLTCKDLAQFADLWSAEYKLPPQCKGATYTLFH
jgi:hypothetical protein